MEGTPPEEKDYHTELVGEGKRYKDDQQLAKAKYHADLHIQAVERSNDELRADYLALLEKSKTWGNVEQLLDQQRQLASREHTITKEVEKPVDPLQMKNLISQEIKEYETSKVRTQNSQAVVEKLKERYGQNYQNILNEKATALGLTKEMINRLAEEAPKAFFKTLELEEFPRSDPFQAPPRSSVFQPTGQSQKRTWSYYQNLKKSDPKEYYKTTTSNQMEKDYIALGAEFEDGDFKRFGDTSFG